MIIESKDAFEQKLATVVENLRKEQDAKDAKATRLLSFLQSTRDQQIQYAEAMNRELRRPDNDRFYGYNIP